MNRAVFWDRDGVLNEAVVKNGAPYPPSSLHELRIDPYARTALLSLRRLGFVSFIVTNQPDVARGTQSREAVEEINNAVLHAVGAQRAYTCFHDDGDRCKCRKPLPGLILEAAKDFDVDVKRSYLVGDRVKDVLAGKAAGCATIYIDRSYSESTCAVPADEIVTSLREAADAIAARER